MITDEQFSFISQKIKIDPAASGTIDLGTLKLLSATTLKITYRTRIRKNGKKNGRPMRPTKPEPSSVMAKMNLNLPTYVMDWATASNCALNPKKMER